MLLFYIRAKSFSTVDDFSDDDAGDLDDDFESIDEFVGVVVDKAASLVLHHVEQRTSLFLFCPSSVEDVEDHDFRVIIFRPGVICKEVVLDQVGLHYILILKLLLLVDLDHLLLWDLLFD